MNKGFETVVDETVERPVNYGLTRERVKTLKGNIEKGTPLFSLRPDEKTNPYNVGQYGFTLMALAALGANKRHKLVDFVAKLKEIESEDWTRKPVLDEKGNKTNKTQTAWQVFKNKDVSPRAMSEESAYDLQGKILLNLEVLQRPDYGMKLSQFGTKVLGSQGCAIDIFKTEDGTIEVMLNTDSKTPINESRRSRVSKAKAPKVEKTSKSKVEKPKKEKTEKAPKTPKAPKKVKKEAPVTVEASVVIEAPPANLLTVEASTPEQVETEVKEPVIA